MKKLLGTLAVLAVLAPAAVLADGAPLSAQSNEGALLSEIRAATGRFQYIENALAEEYGQFQTCTAQPGAGAMGLHFVNGAYVSDTVLDPALPEALLYEPQADGRLKLVAVEYIVFAAAWDAQHSAPPSMFGQQFHLVGFPNRYGIPAFYELHVWVWRNNPAGLFVDWNPEVVCL